MNLNYLNQFPITKWAALHLCIYFVLFSSGVGHADPLRLFWSDSGSVERANFGGGGQTTLASGFARVDDVEIDESRGDLYWNNWTAPTGTAGEGIYRSDLNGAGALQFTGAAESTTTTGFASGMHGISIDETNGVVYFTRGVSYADGFGRGVGPEVSKINVDGTGYTKLNPADTGWFLSGVVVDSANSVVYYGSPGCCPTGPPGGDVNRIGTDGSSPTELVTQTFDRGRSLALDPNFGPAGTVFYSKFDSMSPGTGGEILAYDISSDVSSLILDLTGVTGVPDIELDTAAQRIYWTEYSTGLIRSGDYSLGAIGSIQTEISGLTNPFGLTLQFIPEPSTSVMGLLGLLMLSCHGRRGDGP